MNIFKRELRAGLKTFLIWTAVLFVLVFIGIIKFEGVSSGGSTMTDLLASFPRVVLSVMGIVGVDIGTLPGYTAILSYYVLICVVIYALHLGSSTVTRELADKTYEFVFTKPVTRSRVLALKLTAGWIYLFLFCFLNAVFSLAAASSLKQTSNVTGETVLFTLSIFLVGSLFIALSAFLAAISKFAEKGTLYGNLAFLYAFVLGVICNTLDNPGLLKLVSPFNYFSPADLIAEKLDPAYSVMTLMLVFVFLLGAFRMFKKKDLV